MKKKTIILTVALIIGACFLVGAAYMYNAIFPKAAPITSPDLSEVISVNLGCNTPDGTISMNEQYYKDLLRYISESTPTRRLSLDDYPSIRPYYSIEIQTKERQYRYFVYEDIDQVYLESPYEGIYEVDTELFDLIFDIVSFLTSSLNSLVHADHSQFC